MLKVCCFQKWIEPGRSVQFTCDFPKEFRYKPDMALAEFRDQHRGVELLQRSLARGRLGHAYLLGGEDLDTLTNVARSLAKVIHCAAPVRAHDDEAVLDSCESCSPCRRVESASHPDVLWVRPESKSRVIVIEQIRELLRAVSLKPTESRTKVAILVAADRMNPQAANAFLKTLEEPPGNSVLILLSTQPQNLLETIRSRCLFLRFGGDERRLPEGVRRWLAEFASVIASSGSGLMRRYEILGRWLAELETLREQVTKALRQRSPLEQNHEVEPKLREKWESELKAAVEAEYRRLRMDYLTALQWFFRDVWVRTMGAGDELLALPDLRAPIEALAGRVAARDAQVNVGLLARTQRLLETNLQEALVLEVALLRLRL